MTGAWQITTKSSRCRVGEREHAMLTRGKILHEFLLFGTSILKTLFLLNSHFSLLEFVCKCKEIKTKLQIPPLHCRVK